MVVGTEVSLAEGSMAVGLTHLVIVWPLMSQVSTWPEFWHHEIPSPHEREDFSAEL